MTRPKLLVILGPTASGKSTLAVRLAKQFSGEVISADSRQVYRGLDIGSSKITPDEIRGVPHHLLSVAEPNDYFSVADFKKLADTTIADILRRGKLPILAGGTGLYIRAVVDNVVPPEVPPDEQLRQELAEKSSEELYAELKRLDPARAETIERENPRRLIRAIEIARTLGSVPEADLAFPADYRKSPYDVLQIGLKVPMETLRERIKVRVRERLERGWVDEARELLDNGLAPERLVEFGLGYRVIAGNFNNPVTTEKLVANITLAERRYAKRQLRWFKRDPRIQWFTPDKQDMIVQTVTSWRS